LSLKLHVGDNAGGLGRSLLFGDQLVWQRKPSRLGIYFFSLCDTSEAIRKRGREFFVRRGKEPRDSRGLSLGRLPPST